MDRYQKSQAYLERALKVTPGGAQTLSKRAGRFPEGAYPAAVQYGDGAHVVDVDGHRYLDMICGLACMTLGYSDGCGDPSKSYANRICKEVELQLWKGASFSLAHPLEAEVAEKLCAMIPCAESVRFVKTGSEATEAAIRVARKATGHDLVLTVGEGYHSWHSWFQSMKPEHPGIPWQYGTMTEPFKYNDLKSLSRAFWYRGHVENEDAKVAAVILEPCLNEPPAPGFLQGVRDLCTKHGAVLIFDEMVTGFRWAKGGAQEYFGVTPDLATFGKACANGFPLAFLCGKHDLMEHADVISGTFGGEALSLAACSAVLDIYQHEPIIETLWARGRQLQDGFNVLAGGLGVPAICDGFSVKPRIKFTETEVRVMKSCSGVPDPFAPHETNNLAMSLFLQETALRGILWHPAGGNISAAMTERDIAQALDEMGTALLIVKQALDTGDWSALQGTPIQSTPFVRKV